MTTFWLVLPLDDPTASIAFTTSMPLTTLPNTTCFPSNQAVLAVQRKNCEPLLCNIIMISQIKKKRVSKRVRIQLYEHRYKHRYNVATQVNLDIFPIYVYNLPSIVTNSRGKMKLTYSDQSWPY